MGILVVYDVTHKDTFDEVRDWMKLIDRHAEEHVNKILVGNKCDLPNREVTTEMGKKMADKYGIKFMETSAKDSINVEELFFTLARDIKIRLGNERLRPDPSLVDVSVVENTSRESSSCCLSPGAPQTAATFQQHSAD